MLHLAELRGRITVLVANAPYVPAGAIAFLPPEARDHEPQSSLDGGADELAVHRHIMHHSVTTQHHSVTGCRCGVKRRPQSAS